MFNIQKSVSLGRKIICALFSAVLLKHFIIEYRVQKRNGEETKTLLTVNILLSILRKPKL